MSLPIIQTIQNNINSLKSTKTDIKNAVNTDYDFIANEQIESYPGLIKQGIAHYKNRVPHATKEGTDLSFNAAPLKFENMTIKGDTSQATRILPEGYTQLDYIESTGTQYIDTGINADSNLRTLLDIVYTTPSGSNQNIGAIRLQTSASGVRYHLLPQSGKIRFYTNNSGVDTINIDTNRHVFDMDVPNRKIIVDGTEYQKPGDDFDVGLNFYIFGRNSTSTIYLTNMKLYKCKMWYNNVLVREYVPCKDSNNVVGLYDLVSQTFFGNDGTGDFVAGNEVSIPNPDYPQDIHVVTGNNVIKRTGKNLLDITDEYIVSSTTGYELTISDGNLSLKSTASQNKGIGFVLEVNPTKQITVSYADLIEETVSVNNRMQIAFYNEKPTAIELSNMTTISKDDKVDTFVPTGKYMLVVFRAGSNTGGTFIKPIVSYSNDLTYEPYHLEEYPVNLGSLELCKIGDYQDYLYKENGNWYKYGAIDKTILTNLSGNWTKGSLSNETYSVFQANFGITRYIGKTTNIFSDKFIAKINTEIQTLDAEGISTNGGASTTGKPIRISILNSRLSSVNANGFKTWLGTNNVTAYIPLFAPTTTQITDTTLIEQLEALDKAKGNNGTTIITSNGTDLAPILNFTAYLKEVE